MPSLKLEALLLNISQIDLAKSLDQILEEILTITRSEMGAHSGSIMLVDDKTGELEMVATSGLPDDYIERVYSKSVPVSCSPSGIVMETGEYYLSRNLFEETRAKPWRDLGCELGITAQIFMPMKRKGEIIGLLNIYMAKEHDFGEDEIAFVSIAASHAAAVIENARYSGQLEALVNARTAELRTSNEQLLLENEERKRIEENLKGLLNISQIDLTKPLKQILEEILTITGGEMNAHSGTVMLVNDEIGELEMVATYGLPDDYIKRIYSTGVPITSSPSGVVLETGHYYLVPNLFEEPKDKPWHDISRELGFSAQIFMPMKAEGAVIGLLNIYMAEPHDFTEDEIAFVTVAAGQAAAVIENARYSGQLEEMVNERTAELNMSNEHLLKEITERKRVEERLKGLSTISQIDLTKELNRILKEILTITGGEMGAHSGTIMLVDDKTGGLEMVATFGLPDDYIKRIYKKGVPITSSPSGIVLETGEYYLSPNLFKEPRAKPWRDLGRELGITAQIFMPMKQKGEIIGLLNIYMAVEHEFTDDEINFVNIAASQAAAIIEDARLYANVLQKKEELRESEETVRTLLNAPPDAVLLIDTEGKIITTNEFTATNLGKSVAELIGVSVYGIFPHDLTKARKAVVDEVIRSKKPAHHEDKWGGNVLDNRLYPLFDKDGNVSRIAIFARDITERKRAEAALRDSEERFHSFFDNLSVGVAMTAQEGHILAANKTFSRFLGYPQEELIGKQFAELTYSRDQNISKKLYSSLVRGKKDRYLIDKRYVRKDGEIVWGRLFASRIKDKAGQTKYTTVICEDITECKRVEEALLTKNKELDSAKAELIQVADALKMSERKYKEIAEFLPDLIYKTIMLDS